MRQDRAAAARVLVIVPAYNEEANIEGVVRSLQQQTAICDFVVIDDGSTDGTPAILRDLGVAYVSLVQNLGIGGAVQTGYKYAQRHGYRIAVQFDGDGQHDASYIDRLVKPLQDDESDVVVGSRFLGDESLFKSSWMRRIGIRLLSGVLNVSSGRRSTSVKDVTSGFRAVNDKAITLFARSYPSDYPEPETLAHALSQGLRVTEVPVAMHERKGGVSSISGFRSLYYMLKVGLSIVLAARSGKEG